MWAWTGEKSNFDYRLSISRNGIKRPTQDLRIKALPPGVTILSVTPNIKNISPDNLVNKKALGQCSCAFHCEFVEFLVGKNAIVTSAMTALII